jgi:ABC-type polysaccharide/polyol phosphate export permease
MIQHMKAVWTFRYFWMSLVKMDLLTRYRKSVLGVAWSLLHPLSMTAIFCFVFANLMGGGDWKRYAQLTLAGMAVYGFLRDSTLQGTQSLIRHESYIRQIPLPFGIYSLRVMLSNAVHFLITLGVLVALIAVFQQSGRVFTHLGMVLPMIGLAVVLAWALAAIAGFATVYFHDLSHLLEIAAQLLFFLTPIVYGRDILEKGNNAWIADWNPAAAFIETFRKPLIDGVPADPQAYLLAAGTTAAAVALACLTIGKLSKRVIFQM